MRSIRDLFSFIVLMVDLANLPVVLAWDMVEEGLLHTFRIISLCFWALDVVINFARPTMQAYGPLAKSGSWSTI